ncbi:MAG: phosphate acyltransferase PlsX [Candidatus Delongbacteria bacterium]|nr:phosphate acyltransferase PlsX [Candidatus Delongbacteria bacterium]
MIIALDAMGGDFAPAATVQGAVQALAKYDDLELVLTGDEQRLRTELAAYDYPRERLTIEPTGSIVAMGESPTVALKEKKDSSITRAVELVKAGQAQALVSAGNTGAQMATSLLILGRIRGVSRPGIGSFFPATDCTPLILDVGANADLKPQNLLEFAIMGDLVQRITQKITSPRVGLLSIGEEPSKGNELTVAAHQLLSAFAGINFVGNIEGGDILRGTVDVIVCDGFVGNVVLKLVESIKGYVHGKIFAPMVAGLSGSSGEELQRVFTEVSRDLSYEEYGGAPLLGVNGVSIITHGAATPRAIRNSIREARLLVKENLVTRIAETLDMEI